MNDDWMIVPLCRLWHYQSKESSVMMLNILSKFKHEVEHKAELIFVILDRSSSMNGVGIQQAKKALLVNISCWQDFFIIFFIIIRIPSQLFLYSVRPRCYVNFVGNVHLTIIERIVHDDEIPRCSSAIAEQHGNVLISRVRRCVRVCLRCQHVDCSSSGQVWLNLTMLR